MLILVVPVNREFYIHGDVGVHQDVGQSYWDDTVNILNDHFKSGDYFKGMKVAVQDIGEKLSQYFPASPDDADEIDNSIMYDN